MVMPVATPAMNRKQNLAALEMVLDAMSRVTPESQIMENLRRAAYLHAIVEAVLGETVGCLPQSTAIYS